METTSSKTVKHIKVENGGECFIVTHDQYTPESFLPAATLKDAREIKIGLEEVASKKNMKVEVKIFKAFIFFGEEVS